MGCCIPSAEFDVVVSTPLQSTPRSPSSLEVVIIPVLVPQIPLASETDTDPENVRLDSDRVIYWTTYQPFDC